MDVRVASNNRVQRSNACNKQIDIWSLLVGQSHVSSLCDLTQKCGRVFRMSSRLVINYLQKEITEDLQSQVLLTCAMIVLLDTPITYTSVSTEVLKMKKTCGQPSQLYTAINIRL